MAQAEPAATDSQQLRALVRQARKDAQPEKRPISQGWHRATAGPTATFSRLVREQLSPEAAAPRIRRV
jgi:hypothetical protein